MKMLFDSHMHTKFSADSKMMIEEAIKKAQELNIGITLTEHMDFEYPGPMSFLFDVEKYFAEYNQYRSESLLLGIEIGMREDCLTENCKLVEKYPFDYVIGSIHVVDNIDIYLPEFYEGRSKQEVYRQYFNGMLKCVTCYDGIHSLGHIDYIARYAKYPDTEIYYNEFKEHIDEILKVVAQKGKALEINTRRLGSKDAVEVLMPIYQRFYEVGGRFVTIGSDAHRASEIGKGLADAVIMADRAQLKVVYFKDGQPQYMK